MAYLFAYEHTIVMYQHRLSSSTLTTMTHVERSSIRPAFMQSASIASLDIDDDGGNTGPYDDDGDLS